MTPHNIDWVQQRFEERGFRENYIRLRLMLLVWFEEKESEILNYLEGSLDFFYMPKIDSFTFDDLFVKMKEVRMFIIMENMDIEDAAKGINYQ